MAERIGLFGGSFDPIHNGHLIIARAVAEQVALDRVILLPSASPPHKDALTLADAEHRAAMVRLAIDGDPLFQFSDFDLCRPGPSYTVDTVRHFRDTLAHADQLCWIIGADSLAELSSWHKVGQLVDACDLLTAARPGAPPMDWSAQFPTLDDGQIARLRKGVIGTPMIDISSTEIRTRVKKGRSIRYLVPDPVEAYIKRLALYAHHG